jgi:hypothetical protein
MVATAFGLPGESFRHNPSPRGLSGSQERLEPAFWALWRRLFKAYSDTLDHVNL